MSNDSGKEGFVRALFDTISGRYDLFNRLSSLGLDQQWRRHTIARLELTPDMQVLDLASGTGDLAGYAMKAILPLGFVVAYDLSGPMLSSARKKFKSHPTLSWHMEFAQGRAEMLPFRSESFHAATMGFALRNVSDLGSTFKEMHRVLKPKGHLSLLELGRPQDPFLAMGHRLWLQFGVPVVGILTTGTLWPFLYLRRSILQFMDPEEVVKNLQHAGFVEVKAEPLTGGVVFVYRALRV